MPFFKRKSDKSKSPASPKRTSPSPKLTPKEAHGIELPNGTVFIPQNVGSGARPKTLLLTKESSQDIAQHGDLSKFSRLKAQTPLHTSSRLSKTLHEVLHDKDALPYFIQYMDSRDAKHIIKFWLDAESFQAATLTRIQTHSLSNLAKAAKGENEAQSSSSDSTVMLDNGEDHSKSASPQQSTPQKEETTTGASQTHLNKCNEGSNNDTGPPVTLHTQPPPHETHNQNHPANVSDQTCTNHSTLVHDRNKDEHLDSISENSTGLSSQTGVVSPTVHGNSVHSSDTSPNQNNTSKSDSEHSDTPSSAQDGHNGKTQCNMTFQEKLRKSIERDAVNIYAKYIAADASSPIGVSLELRNTATSKICPEDGQVDPRCFSECQEFVVQLMEKDYFPGFLQSDFHCKHQVDILTGSNVYLADILYNEAAMFYFTEFMEQEGAKTLIECWIAIENFQQHLADQQGRYDGLQAQDDAMIIYDKYFSLQAHSPLGFDDTVRAEVECNICREQGPLPDCFSTPKLIIMRTMEKVYFTQFSKSELYLKYLSELINTIQTAQDVPHIKRKRTGSDASSEHSVGSQSTGSENIGISAKNTLLAAGNTNTSHIKKAISKIDDDMRIDNNLLDPDSLWKRPQAGNMTLGRINEMGQFISVFEPEPDHEKKRKSFFANFTEPEETQEAMAMRIAEMILNDVSKTTQEAQESGSDTEQ